MLLQERQLQARIGPVQLAEAAISLLVTLIAREIFHILT